MGSTIRRSLLAELSAVSKSVLQSVCAFPEETGTNF